MFYWGKEMRFGLSFQDFGKKVSSQFDRRLFRSRVHSIETKRQFDRSKGFDRRVSDDKNWDSMLDYSSFFYPLPS